MIKVGPMVDWGRELAHKIGRIVDFGRELARRIGRDDISSYAAALSYNFVFALFPLLLFVTALLAFFHWATPTQLLSGPVATVIPPIVVSLVTKVLVTIAHQRNSTALSLGILGFIWAMSGAFRQIIDAINHAYEYRPPYRRKFWQVYALSIGLGTSIGLVIVAAMALSILGENVLSGVLRAWLHWQPGALLVDVVRWIALLAMMITILAILYAIAPDQPKRFRLVTPGSLVALLAWIFLAIGFSFYSAHFSHYNQVYGTLGSIILLLLYLYLLGFVILLGAEVNALWEIQKFSER